MTCTHPVYLHDKSMYVPCGKCTACKIAHSREWSVRLMHEMDDHTRACFVTLTYDDDHLPVDGSLDKRVLQLFFKRLRKSLSGERLKYFASGEYGDKNGRPHYHAIILGCDDPLSYIDSVSNVRTSPHISKVWGLGLVHYGTVTYDSCRYVCDYTFKKYTKDYNIKLYGNKLPPFQLQSQGIGLFYCDKNYKQIIDNCKITMFGENVGLPLYYKRKVVMYKDRLAEQAKQHKDDLKEAYSVAASPDDEDYIIAWRKALAQSDLNIRAREALKGDKKL